VVRPLSKVKNGACPTDGSMFSYLLRNNVFVVLKLMLRMENELAIHVQDRQD
jgi:hypothetical protein